MTLKKKNLQILHFYKPYKCVHISLNPTQNGRDQTGFSNVLFNIKDGLRLTSAEAYLHFDETEVRKNLHIALNSQARKLLTEIW